MKKRATITIDPEVHARARRLARQRKTTVSGLIESLLASEGRSGGSLVEEMLGSAALAWDADWIVTRNTADYKASPVPAITPEQFLRRSA